MRILATLAAAAGLAALSACGGGAEENAVENFDDNMMMTDNLGTTDMNMTDMNMMNDMNMSNDMNMDMNMDTNATNSADTNTY